MCISGHAVELTLPVHSVVCIVHLAASAATVATARVSVAAGGRDGCRKWPANEDGADAAMASASSSVLVVAAGVKVARAVTAFAAACAVAA